MSVLFVATSVVFPSHYQALDAYALPTKSAVLSLPVIAMLAVSALSFVFRWLLVAYRDVMRLIFDFLHDDYDNVLLPLLRHLT